MFDPLVEPPELEALLGWLMADHGVDFRGHARGSLARRLRDRMVETGAREMASYRERLDADPDESVRLLDALLVHVTGFFRDPAAWSWLAEHAVPRLVARLRHQPGLRIWSAGCSSGEEAYSLAILLAETLGLATFRERVKIFATDRDAATVAKARRGRFTAATSANLPEAFVGKYFVRGTAGLTVGPELRASITFGEMDLVRNAPIGRLDLLVCRNTIMYLDAAAQAEVFDRFAFALDPGGILFLGSAELPPLDALPRFEPISLEHHLFTRTAVSHRDRSLPGVESCRPARQP